MAVPLSVLFSAGLITIELFAKSHKEAQIYIAAMMLLVVIPAVAAMLPGVDLTPKLAIVPLLNVSLLCKELVTGEYHWNYIALIFASTCVYAAGALFLAVKMFQRESVLFRALQDFSALISNRDSSLRQCHLPPPVPLETFYF